MKVFTDLLVITFIISKFNREDLLSPNKPLNWAMVKTAGLALPSLFKSLSKAYLNIMSNSLLKFDKIIEISDIE